MAAMFDKIGKESKDLLGKGMDTHRKFSFEKKDLGIPLLPKFTCSTTDKGKLSSSFTLEGSIYDGVSMKNEGDAGLSSYSTEIGLDMKTLTKVDALSGLNVTVTADQAMKGTVKAEYKNGMAAVCVDAKVTDMAPGTPSYSVGLAPVAGVNCGFSGAGAAPPSKLALAYTQKGAFGAYLGLSGAGFKSAEARAIYYGIDGADVAAKVTMDGAAFKGATVGGKITVDKTTKLTVVGDDKMGLKAGLAKALAPGVTLTVGHAVSAKEIASPAAHTLGWTLEIK